MIYNYEPLFDSFGVTSQIVRNRLARDKGLTAQLYSFIFLESNEEKTSNGIINGRCKLLVKYKLS
jgi:hypothetical protein